MTPYQELYCVVCFRMNVQVVLFISVAYNINKKSGIAERVFSPDITSRNLGQKKPVFATGSRLKIFIFSICNIPV